MSTLGTPAGPAPARPRRRWLVGLVAALLLVGGGIAGAVVLGGDTDSAENPAGKDPAITFPEQWDERVEPYVKIAAEERDLEFKHPVEVRFLTPAEFQKDFRADEEELTEEDRKEIEQFTGLLRAVGMISGDVDLYQAFNDFRDSGTLAYYSTKEKRITVRGTTITPAMKSTLVHELVHVLQDQHFDIGARTEALAEDLEDGEVADNEATVLDAVIEGDASRVETQYRESLSADEQRALDRSEAEQGEDAAAAYAKIPKIVVTLQVAPYTLGEAVVAAVFKDGGNDAVDDLFTETPRHEAALLDAFEVIAGDTGAAAVDQPDVAAGEEKFSAGEFGSLTLLFMLAERIPLNQALAAADSWGGDRYVGYEKGGRSCVRMSIEGDSAAGTGTITEALQAWAAQAPGTAASTSPATSVVRDGDQVLLDSCDPGTRGPAGKDVSQGALALVTSRTYLGVSLLDQGLDGEAAGCAAASLLERFSIAELNDPKSLEDEQFVADLRAAIAACA